MWGSVVPNNNDVCGQSGNKVPYYSSNSWTKYNNDSILIRQLELEDDAAHIIMGGNWRMPTVNELSKLSEVQYEHTTINNIPCVIFNSLLIIPKAGYRYDSAVYNTGSRIDLWSSTLGSSSSSYSYAFCLEYYSSFLTVSMLRYRGANIRGVIELTDAQYKAWLQKQ